MLNVSCAVVISIVNCMIFRYEVAKSKSRLIREDDNDASDDDDDDDRCITMTVNTEEADREKRREAFHAAQDLGLS